MPSAPPPSNPTPPSGAKPGSSPSPAAESAASGKGLDLVCPACRATVHLDRAGQVKKCPKCREKLGKVAQLDQLLARWYEPRRWRADLVRPSVPYLIERLWTAGGQGQRLYDGVAPTHTNYEIFSNMVTRLIVKGVDEGWADLTFPEDPLVEDPQYELKIVDSEKFAKGVERLFPDVDWDETVTPPAEEPEAV